MEKYLIGKKQADNSYVYICEIGVNHINVTSIIEGAIDFKDKETATDICNFLKENEEDSFIVVKATISIEEVVENGTITSK